MKTFIFLVVTNAVLNLVSCQTKSSKVEWQANIGATGADGLLKVKPIVDTKDGKDTKGGSANLQLPGSYIPTPPNGSSSTITPIENKVEENLPKERIQVEPDLPPTPPQLTGKPPPIIPGTTSPSTDKSIIENANSGISDQSTPTKKIVLITPTTPVKTTRIETTLPPTQKVTVPSTTTTKATPPPPVIMVQHSLSGISGPSNVISEAANWIDTDGIYRIPTATIEPEIQTLAPKWPPPKFRNYWPTLAPLVQNHAIVTPSSIQPTVPPVIPNHFNNMQQTGDQNTMSSNFDIEKSKSAISSSSSSSASSQWSSSVSVKSSSVSSQSSSSSSSKTKTSKTTQNIEHQSNMERKDPPRIIPAVLSSDYMTYNIANGMSDQFRREYLSDASNDQPLHADISPPENLISTDSALTEIINNEIRMVDSRSHQGLAQNIKDTSNVNSATEEELKSNTAQTGRTILRNNDLSPPANNPDLYQGIKSVEKITKTSTTQGKQLGDDGDIIDQNNPIKVIDEVDKMGIIGSENTNVFSTGDTSNMKSASLDFDVNKEQDKTSTTAIQDETGIASVSKSESKTVISGSDTRVETHVTGDELGSGSNTMVDTGDIQAMSFDGSIQTNTDNTAITNNADSNVGTFDDTNNKQLEIISETVVIQEDGSQNVVDTSKTNRLDKTETQATVSATADSTVTANQNNEKTTDDTQQTGRVSFNTDLILLEPLPAMDTAQTEVSNEHTSGIDSITTETKMNQNIANVKSKSDATVSSIDQSDANVSGIDQSIGKDGIQNTDFASGIDQERTVIDSQSIHVASSANEGSSMTSQSIDVASSTDQGTTVKDTQNIDAVSGLDQRATIVDSKIIDVASSVDQETTVVDEQNFHAVSGLDQGPTVEDAHNIDVASGLDQGATLVDTQDIDVASGVDRGTHVIDTKNIDVGTGLDQGTTVVDTQNMDVASGVDQGTTVLDPQNVDVASGVDQGTTIVDTQNIVVAAGVDQGTTVADTQNLDVASGVDQGTTVVDTQNMDVVSGVDQGTTIVDTQNMDVASGVDQGTNIVDTQNIDVASGVDQGTNIVDTQNIDVASGVDQGTNIVDTQNLDVASGVDQGTTVVDTQNIDVASGVDQGAALVDAQNIDKASGLDQRTNVIDTENIDKASGLDQGTSVISTKKIEQVATVVDSNNMDVASGLNQKESRINLETGDTVFQIASESVDVSSTNSQVDGTGSKTNIAIVKNVGLDLPDIDVGSDTRDGSNLPNIIVPSEANFQDNGILSSSYQGTRSVAIQNIENTQSLQTNTANIEVQTIQTRSTTKEISKGVKNVEAIVTLSNDFPSNSATMQQPANLPPIIPASLPDPTVVEGQIGATADVNTVTGEQISANVDGNTNIDGQISDTGNANTDVDGQIRTFSDTNTVAADVILPSDEYIVESSTLPPIDVKTFDESSRQNVASSQNIKNIDTQIGEASKIENNDVTYILNETVVRVVDTMNNSDIYNSHSSEIRTVGTKQSDSGVKYEGSITPLVSSEAGWTQNTKFSIKTGDAVDVSTNSQSGTEENRMSLTETSSATENNPTETLTRVTEMGTSSVSATAVQDNTGQIDLRENTEISQDEVSRVTTVHSETSNTVPSVPGVAINTDLLEGTSASATAGMNAVGNVGNLPNVDKTSNDTSDVNNAINTLPDTNVLLKQETAITESNNGMSNTPLVSTDGNTSKITITSIKTIQSSENSNMQSTGGVEQGSQDVIQTDSNTNTNEVSNTGSDHLVTSGGNEGNSVQKSVEPVAVLTSNTISETAVDNVGMPSEQNGVTNRTEISSSASLALETISNEGSVKTDDDLLNLSKLNITSGQSVESLSLGVDNTPSISFSDDSQTAAVDGEQIDTLSNSRRKSSYKVTITDTRMSEGSSGQHSGSLDSNIQALGTENTMTLETRDSMPSVGSVSETSTGNVQVVETADSVQLESRNSPVTSVSLQTENLTPNSLSISGKSSSTDEMSGQSLSTGEMAGQSSSIGEMSGQSSSTGEMAGQSSSIGEMSGQSLSTGEMAGQSSSIGEMSGQSSSIGEMSGKATSTSEMSEKSSPIGEMSSSDVQLQGIESINTNTVVSDTNVLNGASDSNTELGQSSSAGMRRVHTQSDGNRNIVTLTGKNERVDSTDNILRTNVSTLYLSGSAVDVETNKPTDFNFSISTDALFVDSINENRTHVNSMHDGFLPLQEQVLTTTTTLPTVNMADLAMMSMVGGEFGETLGAGLGAEFNEQLQAGLLAGGLMSAAAGDIPSSITMTTNGIDNTFHDSSLDQSTLHSNNSQFSYEILSQENFTGNNNANDNKNLWGLSPEAIDGTSNIPDQSGVLKLTVNDSTITLSNIEVPDVKVTRLKKNNLDPLMSGNELHYDTSNNADTQNTLFEGQHTLKSGDYYVKSIPSSNSVSTSRSNLFTITPFSPEYRLLEEMVKMLKFLVDFFSARSESTVALENSWRKIEEESKRIYASRSNNHDADIYANGVRTNSMTMSKVSSSSTPDFTLSESRSTSAITQSDSKSSNSNLAPRKGHESISAGLNAGSFLTNDDQMSTGSSSLSITDGREVISTETNAAPVTETKGQISFGSNAVSQTGEPKSISTGIKSFSLTETTNKLSVGSNSGPITKETQTVSSTSNLNSITKTSMGSNSQSFTDGSVSAESKLAPIMKTGSNANFKTNNDLSMGMYSVSNIQETESAATELHLVPKNEIKDRIEVSEAASSMSSGSNVANVIETKDSMSKVPHSESSIESTIPISVEPNLSSTYERNDFKLVGTESVSITNTSSENVEQTYMSKNEARQKLDQDLTTVTGLVNLQTVTEATTGTNTQSTAGDVHTTSIENGMTVVTETTSGHTTDSPFFVTKSPFTSTQQFEISETTTATTPVVMDTTVLEQSTTPVVMDTILLEQITTPVVMDTTVSEQSTVQTVSNDSLSFTSSLDMTSSSMLAESEAATTALSNETLLTGMSMSVNETSVMPSKSDSEIFDRKNYKPIPSEVGTSSSVTSQSTGGFIDTDIDPLLSELYTRSIIKIKDLPAILVDNKVYQQKSEKSAQVDAVNNNGMTIKTEILSAMENGTSSLLEEAAKVSMDTSLTGQSQITSLENVTNYDTGKDIAATDALDGTFSTDSPITSSNQNKPQKHEIRVINSVQTMAYKSQTNISEHDENITHSDSILDEFMTANAPLVIENEFINSTTEVHLTESKQVNANIDLQLELNGSTSASIENMTSGIIGDNTQTATDHLLNHQAKITITDIGTTSLDQNIKTSNSEFSAENTTTNTQTVVSNDETVNETNISVSVNITVEDVSLINTNNNGNSSIANTKANIIEENTLIVKGRTENNGTKTAVSGVNHEAEKLTNKNDTMALNFDKMKYDVNKTKVSSKNKVEEITLNIANKQLIIDTVSPNMDKTTSAVNTPVVSNLQGAVVEVQQLSNNAENSKSTIVDKVPAKGFTESAGFNGVTPPLWLYDPAPTKAVVTPKPIVNDGGGKNTGADPFSGVNVADPSSGTTSVKANTVAASPKQASGGAAGGMQGFVGMLTPEQKQALMALLGGTPPVTTTPKPTTPAPLAPNMEALKLKMMQSLLGSKTSQMNPMQAMLAAMGQGGGGIGEMGMGGMSGMGMGMGGMGGMGGMDMAALMEAMGGSTTDPGGNAALFDYLVAPMLAEIQAENKAERNGNEALLNYLIKPVVEEIAAEMNEQMTSQRMQGRRMGNPGFGGRGGGRGFGSREGSGSGREGRRDPMMERMLLERQMRSRRPGYDPSEAGRGGELGEGMSPLLMAAMLGQTGGAGGSGGGDMMSMFGGGMGSGMGGMGGGGDMASLMAAMGGGSTGGMSPMDMMNMMSAMESGSSSSNSSKGGSSSSSNDMTAMLAAAAGMGGGGMGGMPGMGGMGMSELQMMQALMGGGSDPPETPTRGMGLFGMKKKRSAGPGPLPWNLRSAALPSPSVRQMSPTVKHQNSLLASNDILSNKKGGSSSTIPDWLMKKLMNTNNAGLLQTTASPVTAAPPTSVFDKFAHATAPVGTGSNKFIFKSSSSAGISSMMDQGAMAGMHQGMPQIAGGTTPGLFDAGGATTGGMGFDATAKTPIPNTMTPAQIETMFTSIGLIPDQIRDISGGQHGMASLLPPDIKVRAIQMRAAGLTPDQIADTLGDVMQARRAQMTRMRTASLLG